MEISPVTPIAFIPMNFRRDKERITYPVPVYQPNVVPEEIVRSKVLAETGLPFEPILVLEDSFDCITGRISRMGAQLRVRHKKTGEFVAFEAINELRLEMKERFAGHAKLCVELVRWRSKS